MGASLRRMGQAGSRRHVGRAVGAAVRRWHAGQAGACAEPLESRTLLAVTVAGDIRLPGEQDSFSYNFATPRRLYFDSLTNDNRVNWTLVGPPGTVVDHRGFN